MNPKGGIVGCYFCGDSGVRVIIIPRRMVTPRGAHYEFHKSWPRPPGVILNNEYENSLQQERWVRASSSQGRFTATLARDNATVHLEQTHRRRFLLENTTVSTWKRQPVHGRLQTGSNMRQVTS